MSPAGRTLQHKCTGLNRDPVAIAADAEGGTRMAAYETKGQKRRRKENRQLATAARTLQQHGRLQEAGIVLALLSGAPIRLREAGRRSDGSYEFVAGDKKDAERTTPEELEEAQGPKLDKAARRKLKKRVLKAVKRANKLVSGKPDTGPNGAAPVAESAGGHRGSLMHRMGYDHVTSRDSTGRLREASYLPTDEPMAARHRAGLLGAVLGSDNARWIEEEGRRSGRTPGFARRWRVSDVLR